MSVLLNTVAACHMARTTEELNIYLHTIYFKVYSHIWLEAFMLDSTAPEFSTCGSESAEMVNHLDKIMGGGGENSSPQRTPHCFEALLKLRV